MGRFLTYAALGALAYWLFWHDGDIAVVGEDGYEYPGYAITPQKPYEMSARVLGRKRYSNGRESDLSPVDLALGWGPMSDAATVDDLEVSQRGRFYYWRVESFAAVGLSRTEIEHNSANVHVIPANERVREMLSDVDEGDLIELRGQLVNVDAEDGWRWRSSLTFDDTGKGACELLWLEQIEILDAA